jgi:hypothetical protein
VVVNGKGERWRIKFGRIIVSRLGLITQVVRNYTGGNCSQQ